MAGNCDPKVLFEKLAPIAYHKLFFNCDSWNLPGLYTKDQLVQPPVKSVNQ